MGLQNLYTKYPCNSRTDAEIVRQSWSIRMEFCVGNQNVKCERKNTQFRLGLIKQIVKALDKKSKDFKFIKFLFQNCQKRNF